MNIDRKDYQRRKIALDDLCRKHELSWAFHTDTYPITMTVRPFTGVGHQMSLLEQMEEGRTSPTAKLQLTYTGYGNNVRYSFMGSWLIADDLLGKLKKQFSELCVSWFHVLNFELHEAGQLAKVDLPELAEVEE